MEGDRGVSLWRLLRYLVLIEQQCSDTFKIKQ